MLIQAKRTRTASSHLGARVDSALQQLTAQEMLTDAANSQVPPEVANNLRDLQPSCELLQGQRRGKKNNSLSFSACVLRGVVFFSLACP